ncbi:hypothetical protein ACHAO9_003330 [Fusarium lateritium]
MAGTIRAVTILTAGPDGALEGSAWACRETFVAIVVTNLPIIQPLLRKGANMIGLSVLFSHGTKSASQSHQLRSNEASGSQFNSSRRTALRSHPLSNVSRTAAWASDEHILPGACENGKFGGRDGEIVVAQEISVQSEEASEGDSKTPAVYNWGHKASVSRSP